METMDDSAALPALAILDLLEGLPQPACLLEGDDLVWCNAALETLAGLAADALIGRIGIAGHAVPAAEGGSIQMEFVDARGARRHVQVASRAVSGSGTRLVLLTDITEHQRQVERLMLLGGMTERLNVARTAREAALLVLDALQQVVGWEAGFVTLLATEAEQRVLPGHLLIPVLHMDTIGGQVVEVAPVAYVLPESSYSKRSLNEGPMLVHRSGDELKVGPEHSFGNLARRSASLIFVPIMAGTKKLGLLSVQSYRERAYTDDDLRLVELFSEAVANALERLRADERLRLFEQAVLHSTDMVVVTATDSQTDTGTSFWFVNEAFERVSGWRLAEIAGRSTSLLHGPRTDGATLARVREALDNDRPITVELVNYRKDGMPYVVELSTYAIGSTVGWLRYHVSIQRDVTERKRAEERLKYRAEIDPVTHVANRQRLMEQLEAEMAASSAGDEAFALLFLDLDGFKEINDRLGHAAGDLLLAEVARRLVGCVRPHDTVARFGGDEFTLLLPCLHSRGAAIAVADRILERLREPFDLEGGPVRCTASIGLAFHKDGFEAPEELLRRADMALYEAKREGRDRVVVQGEAGEG